MLIYSNFTLYMYFLFNIPGLCIKTFKYFLQCISSQLMEKKFYLILSPQMLLFIQPLFTFSIYSFINFIIIFFLFYWTKDAGILLSNSLVRNLKTSLDWCVENIFSSSDDVNFGRCVLHASNERPCTSEIQGDIYRSLKLPIDFYFDDDFGTSVATIEKIENTVTVYPIFDHQTMYKINAYFAAVSFSSSLWNFN